MKLVDSGSREIQEDIISLLLDKVRILNFFRGTLGGTRSSSCSALLPQLLLQLSKQLSNHLAADNFLNDF